jgi:Ca2+-binding RTX toxin-like protein
MMKPAQLTKFAQRSEDDHFRGILPDAPAQILNPGPGSDNLPYSGVGGPTTVTTATTTFGTIVSVSAERLDGSSIILWVDRSVGLANTDVRGTVVAANGTVLVPSFNVSLTPAGIQDVPAVEVRNSDGAFLAAWRSAPSAGMTSLHTQLFDAAGARIGSEVVVTTGPSDQLEIAPLADGGFMLVWRESNTEGIRAQRFDSAGAELGAEFAIVPAPVLTLGLSYSLAGVHQLASGEIAVTILEDFINPGPTSLPFLRTFDLAGNPTDTAETFGLDAALPEVAYAADGTSIALWKTASGTLAFQRFDADGEKIGGTVPVSPTLMPAMANNQQIGGVVALPSGEYMVVWTGPAFSGTGVSIFGRTFSVDGVRTSPTFELTTSSFVGNSVTLAITDLTAEDDGSVVLTWNVLSAGGYSLLTQRFEPQAYPASGTFTGTPNNDNLVGGTGDDIINALGANDRLYGGAGNDRLNGGTGADVTDGGAGDDFHYVDNLGDVVIELAGEGYDNLQSSIDWVLAEGVYVEVLSTTLNAGTTRVDLTGNSLANVIVGNDGKNVLDGLGGADILVGLGGDDFMLVDAEDRVYENVGGGLDNVLARESYTLLAGQEIEVLSTTNNDGTTAINLTGNEFGQAIVGNNAINVLNGGGGADILQGLGGNDTYVVDTGDRVYEAAGRGFDSVAAKVGYTLLAGQEIELLSTADNGGTAAIFLIGNELGQVLVGNAGNNILDGGNGNDLLQGLSGADEFTFTTALGAGNVDTILDFVSGTDRIAIDNTVFNTLPNGPLNPNAFFAGAAAHDADDRIIYDSATGQLYYDADGNGAGAQVLFATLTGAPVIASTDFQVI